MEVYVVGGAAEDRLTAASEIDVLIITPKAPPSLRNRVWLAIDIRDRAYTAYGLPFDYPVDIHIMRPGEFREARRRYYRRVVRLVLYRVKTVLMPTMGPSHRPNPVNHHNLKLDLIDGFI